MSWLVTQEIIAEWAKKTFKDSSISSTIAHLRDEIDEIEESPDEIEEWADVIILYMNAAYYSGHSMDDILIAVHKKFEKNKNRSWGEPDERGVVKHIDEQEM